MRPASEMARQGQLHEDTVDAVILIQSVHQCLQCLLRCVGGRFKALRIKADLLAGTALVPDIDLRSRVVAHDDHCRTGHNAGAFGRGACRRCDFPTHLRGGCFSVKNDCHIVYSSFLQCFPDTMRYAVFPYVSGGYTTANAYCPGRKVRRNSASTSSNVIEAAVGKKSNSDSPSIA